MTVRRGDAWGEAVTVAVDAAVVRTDADLADALVGRDHPVVIRGGDMHRSLGSPAGDAVRRRLPIDVIALVVDGQPHTAVAHVIARRQGRFGWWRGPIVAVMNVDHVGAWDAAPRAHPNDGWLDVIEVSESMSVRARWHAWRRLRTGSHLPHPDITVRRVRTQTFAFGRPLSVWVDGIARGPIRSLQVEVEPDGAAVYV